MTALGWHDIGSVLLVACGAVLSGVPRSIKLAASDFFAIDVEILSL